MKPSLLLTGSAGFIGFHTGLKLLQEGYSVVGLDNINDYYDPELKFSRLSQSGIEKNSIEWNRPVKSRKFDDYTFYRMNLENKEGILELFDIHKFDYVVHLGAQAGVRYSLINPYTYIESNINGFMNILEGCRNGNVKHLIYASSSSVYGANAKIPFSEDDKVDHPVSLYAATKKSNELMAHTYSHLFDIPTTGLRFFTVYGPWGRPDMAIFLFTEAISQGKPIKVFNNGKMLRDFTFIDDIVEAIDRLVIKPPVSNNEKPTVENQNSAPYKIYNIGNSHPEKLTDFIEAIEKSLNKTAIKEYLPIQPGDVEKTWADTQNLEMAIGYHPETSINDGIRKFVDWYLSYYKI